MKEQPLRMRSIILASREHVSPRMTEEVFSFAEAQSVLKRWMEQEPNAGYIITDCHIYFEDGSILQYRMDMMKGVERDVERGLKNQHDYASGVYNEIGLPDWLKDRMSLEEYNKQRKETYIHSDEYYRQRLLEFLPE